MLLTVLCALMGAFIGLNSRKRVTAALLAAGLATAAYYVLLHATAFLVAFAPDPAGAKRILSAMGAPGPSLANVAGAAACSSLVAGVLLAVFSPEDRPERRKHGQRLAAPAY